MNKYALEDWLNEAENPSQNNGDFNFNDITKDPQNPDMPQSNDEEEQDFETWKKNYLKESMKGDANLLLDLLASMRDKELSDYQNKFVNDNWNVQLIRQNVNVAQASNQLRSKIKQQLDRNNPSVSLVNHLQETLSGFSNLNNILIKLNGYDGLKGDLHRRYLAALLGGVQVGSGGNNEDILVVARNYTILLSTRMNSKWGDVLLGSWSLKEDDAQKYLSDSEQKRLQDGSPDEKAILRKRIILESIASQFSQRAFVINVVGHDGTIYTLGWDIGGSIRSAYSDGKIIIKTVRSDNSEALIDDSGAIIPLVDIKIKIKKETGEQGDDGNSVVQELNFLERRHGMLFLTAELNALKIASTSMPGMALKEIPFNGHPGDLKNLTRCVYSAHDLLMRQC